MELDAGRRPVNAERACDVLPVDATAVILSLITKEHVTSTEPLGWSTAHSTY